MTRLRPAQAGLRRGTPVFAMRLQASFKLRPDTSPRQADDSSSLLVLPGQVGTASRERWCRFEINL